MNTDISVVIVTRNRVEGLINTLNHLLALPEQPPIIVVDNCSTDDSVKRVQTEFPSVTVLALTENRACSSRNEGVKAAQTPLVAFCDDDSHWEPNSLTKAVHYFHQYPHLGLLAAKVFIQGGRLEPVCEAMRDSPITDPNPLPGPAILGFVCCAVVVRREAFLDVGGFNSRFAIAAEERMLSVDFRTKGWSLAYAEDMVARHYPSSIRNVSVRTALTTRDTIWYYWLRRPLYYALRHTWHVFQISRRDANVRKGFNDAFRSVQYLWRNRRVVPADVEQQILKIESFY
ncbi:MAG: glycosyl transferase family 2 [Spirosoma sp.]|nr:glycosyl transferase family 2 [Spirosoma sp.]